MWDYNHDTLPLSLRVHSKKANLVHNYSTRMAFKGGLHYGKINTSKHGIKSFKYQGVEILNDLKNMSIYQNSTSKPTFIKELKSDLLSAEIYSAIRVLSMRLSLLGINTKSSRQSVRQTGNRYVSQSVNPSVKLSIGTLVNLSIRPSNCQSVR